VIVARAQKVRLIVKSRRKDDRLDARMLARLARIGERSSRDSSGCSLGAGTRGRAHHRCTSANRVMNIYGRCGCRERTTFWAPFGEDYDLRRWGKKLATEAGKTPRNGGGCGSTKVGRPAALVMGEWRVCEPLRNSERAMTVAAWKSLEERMSLYRTAGLDRRV
jgi:hypothetical protein